MVTVPMTVVIPVVMIIIVADPYADRADLHTDLCGARRAGHQAQGHQRRDKSFHNGSSY